MSSYREIFPEDFQEGLQFKDYPEATDTYEMRTITRQEEQNLVIVMFSRVGETQTHPWTGRLGLNGTQKSSVWTPVESQSLQPWQEKAVEFFSSHTTTEITSSIKGISVSACDRVLSRQPLTWESFVEAKLTENQLQILEVHFS